MRLAMSIHDSFIATVADFAYALMLVDVENGVETSRETVDFRTRIIPAKVAILDENRVDVFICGAVSRPFAAMVVHCGITLIPFISGSVEDVTRAYLSGNLTDSRFFMPGRTRGMHWCSFGGKGMRGWARDDAWRRKRRGMWL
jgi:predicted Fe-Mo cluster-binding NifX family protein